MLSETTISPVDRYRAVGINRQLVILWILSKEELSVSEIAERVKSPLKNVSHHLSLLRKTGVVRTRRSGQTIYYQAIDQECLWEYPALNRAHKKPAETVSSNKSKKEQ